MRHQEIEKIVVPKRTYISIPFLAKKLDIQFEWKDENWIDYYYLTDNIIDAAVCGRKIVIFPEPLCA